MATVSNSEGDFLVLDVPVPMSKGLPGSGEPRPESPTLAASTSAHAAPSLFYDEGNAVVISVVQDSNHHFLDVLAVSMTSSWRRSLRFARAELMRSIKFSPDLCVVSALWERSATFEFINLPSDPQQKPDLDHSKLMPYSYTCVPHATLRQSSVRSEPFEVYGCEWLTPERLVAVTSTDVELLSCVSGKRQVKQLRSQHLSGGIIWYKWAILPSLGFPTSTSPTAVLSLFTTKDPNAAHPLLVRTSNLQPLSKFEIDTGPVIDPSAPLISTSSSTARSATRQQDVAMIRVYNCVYLVVLWLQPRAFDGRCYAELQLYQFLPTQNCFIKTRIVRLYPFDSLAIAFSVVDDLLIAHHQTTQTCLIFDLNVPCEYDQFVSYYSSLVPPQPATWLATQGPNVAPRVPVLPDLLLRVDGLEAWRLRLRTDVLLKRIKRGATPDVDEAGLCLLVALGRSDSSARWQVVDAIRRILQDPKRKRLLSQDLDGTAQSMFSQSYLLSNQRSRFDFLAKLMPALVGGNGPVMESDIATVPEITPPFSFRLSASPSQSQLANGAFGPALRGDQSRSTIRLATATLLELIRAAVAADRPVEYSLAELLVHYYSSNASSAQQSPGLFQLYQLLQYRVVTDSVPLACSLLSLSRHWPAGYQLSLDMLRRLPQGRGISHAAEVLLTSGAPPIEAVRLINATQPVGYPASSNSPSHMAPMTPSHASLIATASSNTGNNRTSITVAHSRTSSTSAPRTPSGTRSLPVTASVLPTPRSPSLHSMDPRKPLDFAVANDCPSQLLAILTHHQAQFQQQLQNSDNSPNTSSSSSLSWLEPYWDKMHLMSRSIE